jgi:hypothetical protein
MHAYKKYGAFEMNNRNCNIKLPYNWTQCRINRWILSLSKLDRCPIYTVEEFQTFIVQLFLRNSELLQIISYSWVCINAWDIILFFLFFLIYFYFFQSYYILLSLYNWNLAYKVSSIYFVCCSFFKVWLLQYI